MGMGEVCDCQKQRGDVMVKKKKKMKKNNKSITVNIENFLVVQWLGLCTSTAEGLGSIPVEGTKILQATWPGKKKKLEKNFKCVFINCDIVTYSTAIELNYF